MSSAPDGNRFAPPMAYVEDVVESGPGVLASRGSRLGAAVIDVLIAMVAFGLVAWLTPINIFKPQAGAGMWLMLLENTLLGFVLFLAIHGYLIADRGQTVGKMLTKIRIVRSDGSKASFGRIVGMRYLPTSLLASIPFVGGLYGLVDTLMIFRASRRCLHDVIADTIVVTAA